MINIKEAWKKSRRLRIAAAVGAVLLIFFISGFPLGAKVKSEYLSMMRETVLDTRNNATDAFLAKANLTNVSTPEECVGRIFNLMKGNITYIPDNDDYSKTPDEFLRDKGGDCEDFAVFVSYALTKMGVPNRIVVYFSLDGHAYNEYLDNGTWRRLDLLEYEVFTNESYFQPTSEFNQTSESVGSVTNPAHHSPTRKYSQIVESFGEWFRENVLYHILKPYYSTERIGIL